MTAWDYPVIIVAAVLVALGLSMWLMRLANAATKRPPAYDCFVCGRSETRASAKQWRFCPYCGAARDATSLRDLPRGPLHFSVPIERRDQR